MTEKQAPVRKPGSKSGKKSGRKAVDRTAKTQKKSKAAVKVVVTTRPSERKPVELFPHGISVGTTLGRPMLILKDKNALDVLPVWMDALDAGVALAELSQGSGATPHAVTKRIFAATDLRLEACVFTDLVGHHQFVDLFFHRASAAEMVMRSSGADEATLKKTLATAVLTLNRVRADEAMSFCLQAKARFFGSKDYMARCRALDVDLNRLEQNLNQGLMPELKSEIENSSKKQPYVL